MLPLTQRAGATQELAGLAGGGRPWQVSPGSLSPLCRIPHCCRGSSRAPGVRAAGEPSCSALDGRLLLLGGPLRAWRPAPAGSWRGLYRAQPMGAVRRGTLAGARQRCPGCMLPGGEGFHGTTRMPNVKCQEAAQQSSRCRSSTTACPSAPALTEPETIFYTVHTPARKLCQPRTCLAEQPRCQTLSAGVVREWTIRRNKHRTHRHILPCKQRRPWPPAPGRCIAATPACGRSQRAAFAAEVTALAERSGRAARADPWACRSSQSQRRSDRRRSAAAMARSSPWTTRPTPPPQSSRCRVPTGRVRRVAGWAAWAAGLPFCVQRCCPAERLLAAHSLAWRPDA